MSSFSNHYLSKSDFIVARNCPAKLYYKKLKYPSVLDESGYMEYLAEGGYMVGKLATLLYPDGILIDTGRDQRKAIELTEEYLSQENITLFEAAIYSNQKLVRIDILEKKGKNINLIEVKSKSYDSTDDEDIKKKLDKDLNDYIEDVAYQYFVLKERYPEFDINPYLFLPDKAKRTNIEGLNLIFRLKKADDNNSKTFRTFIIEYDENRLEEIRHDNIMTLVNVKDKVLEMQEMIKQESLRFIESFSDPLRRIQVELTKDCFKCEFTEKDTSHLISGYDECWKEMPKPDYHIKNLYKVGSLGGWRNPKANIWIKDKKLSAYDIDEDELTGKIGERQKIQLKSTRENQEWFSPLLKKELESWKYPFHFIDFENTLTALPFHKGMRPYEAVAFQWSCHTIEKPGGEPIHSEWLNLESAFPNFKFAETLMQQIGNKGTFLMWSHHENTILKTIYYQMDEYGYKNDELKDWFQEIVKLDKDDTGNFVDLNWITVENYFHPLMKGKTSIKWTLPAVLSSCSSPRIEKWLAEFDKGFSLFQRNNEGRLINPYNLLPEIEIYEQAEKVEDGTGAMRTYEDLMFGLNKGDEIMKEKYARLLLQYCKLDTLAMIIIWEHWNQLTKKKLKSN